MMIDRVSYLDEAIRDKAESIGPGHYKPSREAIHTRPSSAAAWKTPKKESWKVKKSEDGPDMATYEVHKAHKFVAKTPQSVSMTKSNILTFSA
jgi:hypothetical protein